MKADKENMIFMAVACQELPEEPETKAQVARRHKEEWARFRREFLGRAEISEESAKIGKIVADILKIYQEGERKAFGFHEDEIDTSLSVTWND